MKKLALAAALLSVFGTANAAIYHTSGTGLYLDDLGVPSNAVPKVVKNYNGQPALYTGTMTSGTWGALGAFGSNTVSFTYLGQESGYINKFFSVGQYLLESDVIGTTIEFFVPTTQLLSFTFKDMNTPANFSNGQQQTSVLGYAIFKANRKTTGFDYYLGFNDGFSGDADYDDFVVGVSAVPVPAAALLFGSAVLGAGAFGRRKTAAQKGMIAA